MVARMCPLWNGYVETPFQSRYSWQAFQKNHDRLVWEDRQSLLKRAVLFCGQVDDSQSEEKAWD